MGIFFGFGFWLLLWDVSLFVLGFCLSLLAFWCGKLLEGKRIIEGKRIAKVKLLKEKEWLRRG
jgi:hypothetical protein